MMNTKKAQAAMEFVHTYGWVLLTIIALGGLTLYYFIDSRDDLIPLQCTFNSGLSCLDLNTEEDIIQMVMLNEHTFAMSNITVTLKGTCDTEANTTDGNIYNNQNTLLRNTQTVYVFDCPDVVGKELEEVVNFSFVNAETGQQHSKLGKIYYKPGKTG